MSQVETRDWSAKESTDYGGGRRTLTVAGSVKGEGALAEAVPQGLNDAILILDLTARAGDDWTRVTYERGITPRQFTDVTVRTGDKAVTVAVEVVIS